MHKEIVPPQEVRNVLKFPCTTLKFFSRRMRSSVQRLEGWWNMVGESTAGSNVGEWWLEDTAQPTKSLFDSSRPHESHSRWRWELLGGASTWSFGKRESAWRFNEHGLVVGSSLTSRFVDPTVIPEVEESPDLTRTTLVKRGGRLLTHELWKHDENGGTWRAILGWWCSYSFNRNLQLTWEQRTEKERSTAGHRIDYRRLEKKLRTLNVSYN